MSDYNGASVHHYLDSGLDNVYLQGGFEVVESPYGEGVTIRDMDGLHRCIAKCLVNKTGPLRGSEFRFLRTELDLSQSMMGKLCGRQERIVRNWERSNEPVPEPANVIIRIVYEERFDPSATFERLSKQIRNGQARGPNFFALRLIATADGWSECEPVAA